MGINTPKYLEFRELFRILSLSVCTAAGQFTVLPIPKRYKMVKVGKTGHQIILQIGI